MAQAQDSNPMHQPPGPQLLPQEGATPPAPAAAAAPAPQMPPGATQVHEATFLAARLREALAESANLRQMVADLQAENARMRAAQAQAEIEQLDKAHNVGKGTMLVKKADGTYWRLPNQQAQQG